MSFAPPGESSADLLSEKSLLEGAIVSAAAYGVHFTLFILCFRALYSEPRKLISTYVLLGYITCIFILGTLFVSSSSVIAQYTFIDDRNFPGGPNAFAVEEFSIPLNLLGNVCAIMGTWFADSLLLWRGWVIYRSSNWIYIMLFPALIFLGSFVMSICLLVQISQPSLSLWSSLNFSLPYFTLSLSLNIIVAIFITLRLLSQRRKIVNILGKQHAQQYISIAAMIVESAALYSAFSITFLVLYGLNHPVQNIFLQILPQIEFIAPLLIIYRVAQGRAWTSETTAVVSGTLPRFHQSESMITKEGGSQTRLDNSSAGYPVTRTVEYGVEMNTDASSAEKGPYRG